LLGPVIIADAMRGWFSARDATEVKAALSGTRVVWGATRSIGSLVQELELERPPIVDVVGDRAIAITPVSIAVRANPGVEIDLTSNAYFFDFLERKSGVWKVSRRICVYQKDRMDNVYPSIKFWFMSWFIDTSKFDPAYRFLGAALEAQGFPVQPGQIVDNTAESRALYAEGQAWLQAGD